jgi:hypothetical protein
MVSATNQAKTRWNARHYKQVKGAVEPGTASAFKDACEKAGQSMASVLSSFMMEYSATTADKPTASPLSTRRKCRDAVKRLIVRMEEIRDAEERSKENIPENLHGAGAYEAAEESINVMEEVIDLMGTIY